MSNNQYKFKGKYIIKANLRCKTGLHIGGTEVGFEIGGLDNPVIKDPITGYPYIPGSSLKGKMRSLLEWAKNRVQIKEIREKGIPTGKWKGEVCNCGSCEICMVFGASADTKGQKEPTRLIIRDSFPSKDTIQKWQEYLGENIYTEVKTENAIDRLTSAANPRQIERVPADSVFEVEMIYDIYKDDDVDKLKIIFEGMMLLEDSALGGGGSRGSGKVVFENIRITKRGIGYYTKDESEEEIPLKDGSGNPFKDLKSIYQNFDKIFKQKP